MSRLRASCLALLLITGVCGLRADEDAAYDSWLQTCSNHITCCCDCAGDGPCIVSCYDPDTGGTSQPGGSCDGLESCSNLVSSTLAPNLRYRHAVWDYRDPTTQDAGGCRSCGSSSPAPGLGQPQGLSLRRSHYYDTQLIASFGPTAGLNWDVWIHVYPPGSIASGRPTGVGGWQVQVSQPMSHPVDFLVAVDGAGTGVFHDNKTAFYRDLRFFDGGGNLVADPTAAVRAVLRQWGGSQYEFEIYPESTGKTLGRLTRYVDRNGNAVQSLWKYGVSDPALTGSLRTKLTIRDRLVDAYGRAAAFTYDETRQWSGCWCVSRIDLPTGGALQYHYAMQTDPWRGQTAGLASVDHPDGSTTTLTTAADPATSCLRWSITEPHDDPTARVKRVYLTMDPWIDPANPAHQVGQIFGRVRILKNGNGEDIFEAAMRSFPTANHDDSDTRSYYMESGRLRAMVHTLGDALTAFYDRDPSDGLPLFHPTADWSGWVKTKSAIPGPNRLGSASVTDGVGHTITRDRDPVTDRPVAVHYPDGTTLSITYNAFNEPLRVVDRLGRITDRGYDAHGNQISETVAVGTPLAATTTWERDAQGRITALIDALGRRTAYAYTAAGDLASIAEPPDHPGDAPAVTRFAYDAAGRRIGSTDPSGRVAQFAWDGENRIVATTYPDGSTETSTYAVTGPDAGLLVAQSDRDGRVTSIAYDLAGRRTRVVRAAGTPAAEVDTWSYVPNTRDLVAAETRDGQRTVFGYDDRLRRTSATRFPSGAQALTTTTTYDNADRVVATRDPYGRTTALVYDVNNRVVRTVRDLVPGGIPAGVDLAGLARAAGANPAYVIEDSAYDAEGQLVARTDARGIRSLVAYDAQGRVIAQTEAADSLPATTGFGYDLVGNRTQVTSPRGIVTTTTYTGRNLPWQVTEAVGTPDQALVSSTSYTPTRKPATTSDALGRVTAYQYGICCDRLRTIIDPAGFSTTCTYDFVGNRLSMTDGNGLTTTTAYDARNRVAAVTNAAGETTSYAYDEDLTDGVGLDAAPAVQAQLAGLGLAPGVAVGSAVAVTNPAHETAYELRDGTGRPVVRLDALGHATRLGYDAVADGLVETASTDALGHVSRFRADAAGRVRVQVDALGQVSTAAFDADGNQTASRDANGIGWDARFDDRNRLVSRTTTRSDLPGTTAWGYDLDGNRVSETDALGKTELSGYDARNRRVSLTDRLGGITRFACDAVGNLVQISDADNEARGGLANRPGCTEYAYDLRNLLIAEAFPVGRDAPGGSNGRTLRTYTFDGGRRLVARHVGVLAGGGALPAVPAFAGSVIPTTYAYDAANRLLRRGYADGRDDAFLYDLASRLVQATSDRYSTAINRVFDHAGRLTGEHLTIAGGLGAFGRLVLPALYQVRYAYDAANRTTGLTYPDGQVVTRAYSDRNELTGVAAQGGAIASRTYDAGGRLVATTAGNGLVEARSYVPGSPLIATLATAAPGPHPVVAGFGYTYDADERKLSEADLVTPADTQTFAYDAAGRLIDWHRGQTHRQRWDLSLVGDWNSTTRDGVVEPRANTWVHEAVEVGAARLAYDAQGNLTVDEQGQRFAWDPENRLSSGRDLRGTAGRRTASYAYDALGRRVAKTVDGRRTDYVPAGAQVVMESTHRAVAHPGEVRSDGARANLADTPIGGGILPTPAGSPAGSVIRINFQPANESIPTGYLADKGRTFARRTNGLRYGWTGDQTGAARVRGMVSDPAWDTLVAMDGATFRIALPNGSYPVAIVAGDAAFTDHTDNLTVNPGAAQVVLTDPTPATNQPGYAAGKFAAWTETITVSNGYLTIAAGAGALNPKLCLIEIGPRGAAVSQATRDALAQRVQALTTETAGSGFPPAEAAHKSYMYGSYIDEVLMMTRGASKYYMHANDQYTVAAVTDSTGAVVEKYRYTAYGARTVTSPSGVVLPGSIINFNRGHTGYILDTETGLYQARSRYYSPTLGRFLNRMPWWSINHNKHRGGNYSRMLMTGIHAAWMEESDSTGISSYRQGRYSLYDFVMDDPANMIEPFSNGHRTNTNPANLPKHEKGDARRQADRGGEKGDARRPLPRVRPPGWKGSWPPKGTRGGGPASCPIEGAIWLMLADALFGTIESLDQQPTPEEQDETRERARSGVDDLPPDPPDVT